MTAIHVENNDSILHVRLARPEVRNAFDETLIRELREVFSEPPEGARVIVLSGEGAVFSAGADLRWMANVGQSNESDNIQGALELGSLFDTIDQCVLPVICAVHGSAMGGALGLMSACDVVFADEECKFGFREVRLGLVPAVISPLVVRRIGQSAARRYFITGEVFGSDAAKEMGLVHEVALEGTVMEHATAMAYNMKKCGPGAVREVKLLLRGLADNSFPDVRLHTAQLIARLRASSEASEGIAAFLQKRDPSW